MNNKHHVSVVDAARENLQTNKQYRKHLENNEWNSYRNEWMGEWTYETLDDKKKKK